MKDKYDVVVVGGGPAGLAAAISAAKAGAADVLLLERNEDLGGILNQCIHNGFGLHYFKEELTGPEYAQRFVSELSNHTGVRVLCGAMVLEVDKTKDGCTVQFIHSQQGCRVIRAGAVVLAMGSRERSRGALGIPGTRPAGVLTAGAAQLYMNIEGYHIGRRVVILGSGDIGLIMARRLTLEGAKVLGVYELMPYSGGLMRNIVQCLHDFDIPLHLSHTITKVMGDKRVEAVQVQKVDENRNLIHGTEEIVPCDTLLLSVGLIPENELTRSAGAQIDAKTQGPAVYENMQTSLSGVFACGNVAHIHDLVDFVTVESNRAGEAAAAYAMGSKAKNSAAVLAVKAGQGVSYAVPQYIRAENVDKGVDVSFRVRQNYQNVVVEVSSAQSVIARYKREVMAPGEMEKISLPSVLLQKAKGDELTISIVKGDEA